MFVAYHYAILLCAYAFVFQVLTGVLMLQLPPFDILIVYACTYVFLLNAMLLSTQISCT